MALSDEEYLEKIQKKHGKESTLAAALVWHMAKADPRTDVAVDDIIETFVSSGLKSSVNKPRLMKALSGESGILKGTLAGHFRCSLRHLEDLETKFSVDGEHTVPRISYSFLAKDTFSNRRAYLVEMCKQINGTYEYEFYDGCAVLMRRLMESLLIEVFETAGEAALIKDGNGNYKMLNGIISALGQSSVRFARGTDGIITNVKKVGDNAAHGRTHVTKKNDINDLKIDYRKLISELKSKAQVS